MASGNPSASYAHTIRRHRWLHALLLAALGLAGCSGGGAADGAPAAVVTVSAGGVGGSATPAPTTAAPSTAVPAATSPSNAAAAGFTTLTLKVRPQQFTAGFFCPPLLEYGAPSSGVDFLCRTGFAIGHDPNARIPAWVVERLGLAALNGDVRRSDNFRADPDLMPGRRAELADYAGSGFDRGHMAPAGNLTWSNQAMLESFYLSNIAPQNPALNRGAWAKLEQTIRDWVLERNDLLVITGPVFGAQDGTIGSSPIRVPQAYFKVVFDPFRREVVAFVYPNHNPATADPADHRVPLEQLERTTGLALLSVRQ